MRNFAIFLLLCLSLNGMAGTVDPTYTFSDFTDHPLNVSRVTITPIARDAYYSGSILSTRPLVYTKTAYPTLTNGTFTATNLVNGYAYRVEISDSYQTTTVTNYFGTNVTGSVDAVDYLTPMLGLEQGVVVRAFFESGSTGTGGEATNVFFYPGQNTAWRTSGGSNVVDLTGTLTNGTTGNAAVATNLYAPSTIYHNSTNSILYGTNWSWVTQTLNTNFIIVASAGTTGINGNYYWVSNTTGGWVYRKTNATTAWFIKDVDDLDYYNSIRTTFAQSTTAGLYGSSDHDSIETGWTTLNGSAPFPTVSWGYDLQTNVTKTLEMTGPRLPLTAVSSNTLFVSPSGDDGSAQKGRLDRPWRSVDVAATNASANETIFLLPGSYTISNGIALPSGGKLVGSGPGVSIINSYVNFASSAAIIPNNNVIVSDLTVANRLCCDASQTIWGYAGAYDAAGYTNAIIRNCKLWGGSDITMWANTNASELTIEDSDMENYWDGQTLSATSVANKLTIRRSRIFLNATTNNVTTAYAIKVLQPAIVTLEDVNILVAATNTAAHAAIYTSGLGSGATIRVSGGSITVTNSAAWAIQNTASASITVANCWFETNKVSGTVVYAPTTQPVTASYFTGAGPGITNISWTNLINVPAGFADGTDDGAGGTTYPSAVVTNGASFSVTFSNNVTFRGTSQIFPLFSFDSSTARGFAQQQADGTFQVTRDGSTLTNISASAVGPSGAVTNGQTLVNLGSVVPQAIYGPISNKFGIFKADGQLIDAGDVITNRRPSEVRLGSIATTNFSLIYGASGDDTAFYPGPNGAFAIGSGSDPYSVNVGVTNGDITAGAIVANGAMRSTTNYVSGGVTVGGVFSAANYLFTTNGNNVGTITVGQVLYTNITGNVTLGGFSGVTSGFNQWAKVIATNSTATDYKITLAASVTTSTNAFVVGQDIWVTNKSKVHLMFDIGPDTNCAAVRFQR